MTKSFFCLWVACALLFSTLGRASDKPHTEDAGTQQRELGLQAVRRAVAIAQETDVASAGQLFVFAGGAVRTLDPSAARNYYSQALAMAEKLPVASSVNQRVSVQTSAVAGMAHIDPIAAMELFRRIDRPEWTQQPNVDMRSWSVSEVARELFRRNGFSKVDELTALFDYLGDTGQYPYAASSYLMSELQKRHESDRLLQVFSDALRHLENDVQFVSAPTEFTELLLDHARALPSSMAVAGIRGAVGAGKRSDAKQHKNNDRAEQRTMVLNKGESQVRIKKQATFVALRLMPLASRLDTNLAEELRRGDPDLKAATALSSQSDLNKIAKGSPGLIIGDGSQPPPGPNMFREYEVAGELKELSERDPANALARLPEVQDPRLNVQTQAAIAVSLARTDPARAASLLESAWSKSAKIEDAPTRLPALVSIAEAWLALNNPRRVQSVVAEGISIAREMYEEGKDAKVDIFLGRHGVNELATLASILARVDPWSSMQLAESIDRPEAKAYALLQVAQTLLNPRQQM
jgi:hypothetical protein